MRDDDRYHIIVNPNSEASIDIPGGYDTYIVHFTEPPGGFFDAEVTMDTGQYWYLEQEKDEEDLYEGLDEGHPPTEQEMEEMWKEYSEDMVIEDED